MLSFEFCCIVQVPVLSVAFWDILLVPYNIKREKYTDIDIATSHPMSKETEVFIQGYFQNCENINGDIKILISFIIGLRLHCFQ